MTRTPQLVYDITAKCNWRNSASFAWSVFLVVFFLGRFIARQLRELSTERAKSSASHFQWRSFLRTDFCQWLSLRMMVFDSFALERERMALRPPRSSIA